MKLMRVMGLMGLVVAAGSRALMADVTLPSIFGDHMVLQQDRPIPVWGWAEPGEPVTVKLWRTDIQPQTGDQRSATADASGRWRVVFDAMPTGGVWALQMRGANTIRFNDILIGEVWVCSGQSNMQWPMTRTEHAKAPIAKADHPSIRLITVQRNAQPTPHRDCDGEWSACTPQTVADFSAVGYYFGRHLHQQLDVPVGLINTSWGGTRSEAWTPRPTLEAEPALRPLLDAWAERVEANAKLARDRHRPANLYNGMIHPLIPFAIRGAIWYQGEANVGRAWQYRTLFPALIRAWRARWGQGDFPFYFVQLAPFKYDGDRQQKLPELWDAQLHTLRTVRNTGMAVTTDIATIHNIHPPNKLDVGRRLAAWALAETYGRAMICSGPIFRHMIIRADRVTLHFEHVGNGLKTSDGQAPVDFTIAGDDRVFHPAEAEILGDVVVVHSDAVAKPSAVRFGWYNIATPNLINSAGLPASPFRTDRWPLLTHDVYVP